MYKLIHFQLNDYYPLFSEDRQYNQILLENIVGTKLEDNTNIIKEIIDYNLNIIESIAIWKPNIQFNYTGDLLSINNINIIRYRGMNTCSAEYIELGEYDIYSDIDIKQLKSLRFCFLEKYKYA